MQKNQKAKPSFWERYQRQLLLSGIGLFVFFNSLFGSFVWDDVTQIQNNLLIHSLSNIPQFFLGGTFAPQNSTNLAGLYYRPLMTLCFSLLYALFGNSTFAYHLLQLGIHIVNSLLLFYIFKRFFNEKLSVFLSIIFLIHPMQVESVAYISGFQEPLFFVFGIMSLVVFSNTKQTTGKFILAGFLLLCSLLSKETGILFGGMLLAYFFILKTSAPSKTIQTVCIIGIPTGIYLFLRFFVAKIFVEKIPDVSMMTATLQERIFTMPLIFFFYLKTFFFPKDLFIDQQWMVAKPDIFHFFLPLLFDGIFVLLIVIAGFWLWKKNKPYFRIFLFFAVWFFIGIGFHLQIVPLDMTVSDRMVYFPIAGLLGMCGIIFQTIHVKDKRFHFLILPIAVGVLFALSIRTVVRNANWNNGLTLFAHDLKYQQNDRLENLLTTELFAAGRYGQAEIHFKNLLKRNPGQSALVVNLALTYETEGKLQDAETVYQQGLSIDDTGTVFENYARFLLTTDHAAAKAEKISTEGLKRFPQNSQLHLIHALSIYKLGNKHQALLEIQQVENSSPNQQVNQLYKQMQNDSLNL